jgi:hypothetical protein
MPGEANMTTETLDKKTDSRQRQKMVNFRVKPEERDQIKADAEAAGMSVGNYLNHLLQKLRRDTCWEGGEGK